MGNVNKYWYIGYICPTASVLVLVQRRYALPYYSFILSPSPTGHWLRGGEVAPSETATMLDRLNVLYFIKKDSRA